MHFDKVIAGSIAVAAALMLAFWQFEAGGIPWLLIPGAGALLPGEPVELATYEVRGGGLPGCILDFHDFLLVADPVTGTRFADDPPGTTSLLWPAGYVGRRVGSEVDIFTASGQLAAVTGRWWQFAEDGALYGQPDGKFRQCGQAPLPQVSPYS
jgi:hypothetical protein